MKKYKNKVIIIFLLLAFVIMLIPTNVHAGLQANKGGTSLSSENVNTFFTKIREMETAYGTLGVASNIDATTALDSSANGIDCHMAKNTEWGTAAMLSASIYGSAPSGTSDASTTGNNSGIFQMADIKKEYVANIYKASSDGSISTNTNMSNLVSADARYTNLYVGSKSLENSFAGDGIIETDKWKNAGRYNEVKNNTHVYIRGDYGLFSYQGDPGGYSSSITSRAVVVCGSGL